MTQENDLQARIMLAVGALPGVRVFRNTVGEGWTGKQVRTDDRSIVALRGASRVTFGLHPGSHDLIGWREVVITPEMVGRRVAVFLGGEVKTETGRVAEHQAKFGTALEKAGGLSFVWRSPAGAVSDVTRKME